MDWYHWIAARSQEERQGKHPAWRPGGAAHAQWRTMEAYIVRNTEQGLPGEPLLSTAQILHHSIPLVSIKESRELKVTKPSGLPSGFL